MNLQKASILGFCALVKVELKMAVYEALIKLFQGQNSYKYFHALQNTEYDKQCHFVLVAGRPP